MTSQAATEYRNVPLTALEESKTNPRRVFDETALKELAESIRSQGVLSPLLVRPITDHRFEIVAGARRYRAALLAEADSVPVRIVPLTDAQALEAQLIENLQRRDVHPLEEAQGFRALLMLDEPKYSIEQIAAKTGKSPSYCLQRIKLTELAAAVTEAFAKDEIGIGHALLLAKLQPAEQEQALAACYLEQYSSSKPKRILLPVRHLKEWIEQNILLILKDAPFSKSDATLNPAAGSCVDCPKRTGANALLFADIAQDACTDPACYQAKVDGFVKQSIAAKPKLVQISSAYGQATEGSAALPRNKYVEIHTEKPTNQKQRDWPEYKTCKFTTEAIVTEGTEKGELRKICANPDCPIHHARKQKTATDAAFKAEQEKRRREEAIAQATGLRVLKATSDAVPVRLMKRDLLFITERLAAVLDERRLAVIFRLHGIGKANGAGDTPAKLLASFLRKADESTIGRVLVAITVLQAAHSPNESAKALREAAEFYKVDVAAITAKVKQEFGSKEKAQAARKATERAKPSQSPTAAPKKAKAA
ncbi:MAG: ParB/RepB/Spo0J family partition protein [Acidobacteriaceae bacterium]